MSTTADGRLIGPQQQSMPSWEKITALVLPTSSKVLLFYFCLKKHFKEGYTSKVKHALEALKGPLQLLTGGKAALPTPQPDGHLAVFDGCRYTLHSLRITSSF